MLFYMLISNRFTTVFSIIAFLLIWTFLLTEENEFEFTLPQTPETDIIADTGANATSSQDTVVAIKELPEPLAAPPEIIKAVYATSWSASQDSYIDYLFDLASTTEMNAVVIDVKDFSGYVAYDTGLPEVEKYKAERIRISDLDALIEKLHNREIYAIARISVFQDPRLARARPDLAIQSKVKLEREKLSTSTVATLWLDKKGLAWIDPAAQEAWEYNAAIAQEVKSHGFDELNFDYIRFPSDGDLSDMVFPFWDEASQKRTVIGDFFRYLRQKLPETKMSVDLFGLSTLSASTTDLGIGQVIEDGYESFDYVCPMVYPSHYASGFQGYETPAKYPYEVVRYSMDNAFIKLKAYNQSFQKNAQLRPWLQDFTLTTPYDARMVKLEINAVYDAAGEDFKGFMLWNPNNIYAREALKSDEPE